MCIEGEVTELRSRVRRVRSALPIEPPAGFTRVRADVWQADPAAWERESWPEGTVVELLSLEDVFLAFARTDTVADVRLAATAASNT